MPWRGTSHVTPSSRIHPHMIHITWHYHCIFWTWSDLLCPYYPQMSWLSQIITMSLYYVRQTSRLSHVFWCFHPSAPGPFLTPRGAAGTVPTARGTAGGHIKDASLGAAVDQLAVIETFGPDVLNKNSWTYHTFQIKTWHDMSLVWFVYLWTMAFLLWTSEWYIMMVWKFGMWCNMDKMGI